RDQFARLDLITEVCGRLAGRAKLHLVDGADHSFGVPKRTGRTVSSVVEELAETVVRWVRTDVIVRAR
ncbi:MAG TPA: alpha/beta family hydrolase, partial [Gemmatimonadales bacterium]|nr:alpha/beta family hydrolase [Gemmatimonadales bacterium]